MNHVQTKTGDNITTQPAFGGSIHKAVNSNTCCN